VNGIDFNSVSGIPMLAALILGLLTAISPCPLATNIVAIAYISRRVTHRKYGVMASIFYTVGRMVSYSVIGMLIILIGLEVPGVAAFLQSAGEIFLGPILILVGLLLLNIGRLRFGGLTDKLSSLGGTMGNLGMAGGFLLGALFALAFCPYSAVLFFGALIPIALKSTGGVALPAIFAIGTGLPVLVFGTLLSLGVSQVSTWSNALIRAEKIIRIVTSLVFIGVGIYYVLLWIQST